MPPALVRLESEPLFDTAGSVSAFAAATGVNYRHALRLVKRGLTLYEADRYACRLGAHPDELWGQGWWDACAEQAEQERAFRERKNLRERARRAAV